MAKTIKTAPLNKKNDTKAALNTPVKITKQHKIVLGSLLVLFSIALLVAFVSFFIYGQEDQSAVQQLTDRSETVHNWLGKFGAFLADLLVYKGFGLAAFIFVRLFFLTGMYLILAISLKKLKNIWFFCYFSTRIRRYNWIRIEFIPSGLYWKNRNIIDSAIWTHYLYHFQNQTFS